MEDIYQAQWDCTFFHLNNKKVKRLHAELFQIIKQLHYGWGLQNKELDMRRFNEDNF